MYERKKGKRMLKIQAKAYSMYGAMRDRLEREEGQALVEYALLLALIAIVSIGILTTLGGSVSKVFSKINSKMP